MSSADTGKEEEEEADMKRTQMTENSRHTIRQKRIRVDTEVESVNETTSVSSECEMEKLSRNVVNKRDVTDPIVLTNKLTDTDPKGWEKSPRLPRGEEQREKKLTLGLGLGQDSIRVRVRVREEPSVNSGSLFGTYVTVVVPLG